MRFDFLYNFYPEIYSNEEEFSNMLSWTYLGLHVNFPVFWSNFKETLIFSTYFNKILEGKISEFLTVGSRVFPCGQIDRLTTLTFALRNFANAQ